MTNSQHNLEFNDALACALDNQTHSDQFVELFMFLAEFNNIARIEWCEKRKFSPSRAALPNIVRTLTDLNKLILVK